MRRFEVGLRQPQSVEQHQRVLVAGDAKAAQIELRVLRSGEIADLQQTELGEDVAEIRRGALADVVRGDEGHADRQIALGVRKARRGDDDLVLPVTKKGTYTGEETGDEAQH